jgi:hypothetical protein
MLIPISCDCGRIFRVDENKIGKKGRCPDCGAIFRISLPSGEPSNNPDEIENTLIPIDQFEKSDAPKADESARPFWKDPVFQLGSVVPVIVLSWFGYYLLTKHLDDAARANRMLAQTKTKEIPRTAPTVVEPVPFDPPLKPIPIAPIEPIPQIAASDPLPDPRSKYPPIGSYRHHFKITETYDKFRDDTALRIVLPGVVDREQYKVDLILNRHSSGRKRDKGEVSFYFSCRSEDGWKYLKYHRIVFLVDGDRWSFDPDHDGDVKTGYVLEHLFVRLTEDRFLSLANAAKAEVKIGGDNFEFSASQLEGIKDFASLLDNPESPITNKESAIGPVDDESQKPQKIAQSDPLANYRLPPKRPAKKKPDFSQVDAAYSQMGADLAAQLRTQELMRQRAELESRFPSPFDTPSDNSHRTGIYTRGLCGATCIDGHSCRNVVIGGGFCYIHRGY